MLFSYKLKNQRAHIQEVSQLPIYNVQLSQVQDGEYIASTSTSFLHIKLKVTVENHLIKTIHILEKSGSKKDKAESILDIMIKENKAIVPTIEKEELASVVYISCVDSALKQGLLQDTKTE